MDGDRDEIEGRPQAYVAYETIREATLRCDLGPGEQVSEIQLASSYGFGRAAVRAALTRLGHDRLVQAIPRRGYAVAPITFHDVQNLFGVRLIVEPAAARLAANRADRPTDRPRHDRGTGTTQPGERSHPRQRGFGGAPQSEQSVPRDSRPHLRQRTAGIDSNHVLEELDRVLYLKQVNVVWDRVDATFEEHQRIIDALAARDGRAAEQAAYDHIVPNQRGVIDALIASPGLRSINLVTV